MKMIRMTAGLFAFALAAFSAPRGPNYDDIRSMGMGNTRVAVTTDRTAIFHNPAGLGLLKEDVDISIAPLGATFGGPISSIGKAFLENSSHLGDFEEMVEHGIIDTLGNYDGRYFQFEYIPEITFAKKNLGFGFYSGFPVMLRPETGHFIPKMVVGGQRDLVFTWAVGVPLRSDNHHFGISVEYLQRTPLQEQVTTFTEMLIMVDEMGENSAKALGFVGDLGKVQHGASFDIGFMHDWSGFRLAWDVKDLFGVVGGELVYPQVDIGCAYFFPQVENVEFIRNAIVSFEINDLFKFEDRTEKYEPFGNKIHLGGELDLHYAAIRAGLSQGYPTFGVGVALGLVKIDYAYFGKELGIFPGQYSWYKHVVSLSIGLRVNKSGGITAKDSFRPSPRQETLPVEQETETPGGMQ